MKKFLILLAALCFTAALSSATYAATTCTFTTSGTTMTLNGDCTTDETIIIPDGYTLDGAGYTITAVGSMTGAVVRNGGATANVTNLKITADNLPTICHAGDDALVGIRFDDASGSITNNTITDFNQSNGTSGCQEGDAIAVRNFNLPSVVNVIIDGNTLTNYQKTGILVNGKVNATITDNTINGGGPNSIIARNGIQLGYGATGMVKDNIISGNSYNGPASNLYSAAGIIIYGEKTAEYGNELNIGVHVMKNTLTGNDMGVYIGEYDVDEDLNYTTTSTKTNIKVNNNVITKGTAANAFYTVGVFDNGNNDKIISNKISGYTTAVDTTGANRPKVHANK